VGKYIKLLRTNAGIYRASLRKRHSDFPLDELLEVDGQWRAALQEAEKLKALRNKVTLEIAKTKSTERIREMKEVAGRIKRLEADVAKYEAREHELLMKAPNILHETVPAGKDDRENVELRRWGTPGMFNFRVKDHLDVAEAAGLIDVERAAKVAGARFYYLKGDLVKLDMALQNFALDLLAGRGYDAIEPPLLLRRAPYEGVTDLSDFEHVMYKIDGEDLYLIATSEHAMAAMHMGETFEKQQLPIKYAGISPCFRKEAGAHGKDTKGIFRVHQFNKVEQFVFCTEEQSWPMHEELIANMEAVFQELGLPYRVVNVCTGDIGTVAAKKYDLEVWLPGQNAYREAGSCSNCTDYQARRLGIRYVDGQERCFAHTLNSTAVATSRAMVAIIENFQNENGSITVPEVLRPYMGGQERIG
jgi:seryl-tRNA synthetase